MSNNPTPQFGIHLHPVDHYNLHGQSLDKYIYQLEKLQYR